MFDILHIFSFIQVDLFQYLFGSVGFLGLMCLVRSVY